MATHVSPSVVAIAPERSDVTARIQLAADLRQWWQKEHAGWDEQVTGQDTTGADLWADMPIVDSKTVARMAPLFKKHMGRSLIVRRIRRGGYNSIENVIQHLVYEDDV